MMYLRYLKLSGHVIGMAAFNQGVEPEETGHIGYVSSDDSPENVWVNADGDIRPKETIVIMAPKTQALVGEIVPISLPDPCWVYHKDMTLLATGGTFDFMSLESGVYTLEARGRYQSNQIEITIRSLGEAQDALWERVKAIRADKITGGCPTALGVVDSDDVSQRNIGNAAQMCRDAMANNQELTLSWTMKDDSIVPHTAQQIIDMSNALTTHINACHTRSQNIRSEIYSATAQTLGSILIHDGWPSNE